MLVLEVTDRERQKEEMSSDEQGPLKTPLALNTVM